MGSGSSKKAKQLEAEEREFKKRNMEREKYNDEDGEFIDADGKKRKKQKDDEYLIATLNGHKGGINCMGINDDNTVVITGGEDKTARLWNLASQECTRILKGHKNYITCCQILDEFCYTGSSDRTVRKWTVKTGTCELAIEGHAAPINRLICTGDFLFTSSYDRTAMCWDPDDGELLHIFRGHRRGITPLMYIPAEDALKDDVIDIESNKDILVTGSADGTARSWNMDSGDCIVTFKGHRGGVLCLAADSTGTVLFTGSADCTVKSWNINTGEIFKTFEGHQSAIVCLQRNRNEAGNTLTNIRRDAKLMKNCTVVVVTSSESTGKRDQNKCKDVINKLMYSGSSDQNAKCWVTEFGDCTRTYQGHKHTVCAVRFRDGLLYTGCGDNQGRVYDAKSGALKRTYKGHAYCINAILVLPQKMLTASHDGTVKIWDSTGIKDEITSFGDEDEEKERKKREKEEKKKEKERKKKDKKEREKHEKENKKKKSPIQTADKDSLSEKNEYEKSEKNPGVRGDSPGEKRDLGKDENGLDADTAREIDMINQDMEDL